MAGPEPFDRRLRRIRRDRAASRFAGHGFLQAHIADELLDRLEAIRRPFKRALMLGHAGEAALARMRGMGVATIVADSGFRFARSAAGIQCDEDRLAIRDAGLDLVLAAGSLDTVNDLPGALVLIRRALRPDGLFLGGFIGAGSLPRLRRAMLEADLRGKGAAARIHPQIDVRAAGDLLARAGFALPVADGENLDIAYRDLAALLADLRGSGGSSLLGGPPISALQAAAAHAVFAPDSPGERAVERFALVYMIGWAPSPDQPSPARRGSATASLADALSRKR